MSLSSKAFKLLKKKIAVKKKEINFKFFFLSFLVYPNFIMYTRNKRNFYIIGSNPQDFFDMTIEGVEALLECDLVILSKFCSKTYVKFFKKKKIKRNLFLKKILLLRLNSGRIFIHYVKNNTIALLISGDPHFCEKNDLEKFLKKEKSM